MFFFFMWLLASANTDIIPSLYISYITVFTCIFTCTKNQKLMTNLSQV